MLRGLYFKNFSLLREFHLGLGQSDLAERKPVKESHERARELGSLVGLIGKNSSGKSTIFEGLAFLRDILLFSLAEAASREERGGFARLRSHEAEAGEEMVLSVILDDKQNYFLYSLVLNADRYERPYIQEETLRLYAKEGGTKKDLISLKERQLSFLSPEGEERKIHLEDGKKTALSFLGRVKEFPLLRYVYHSLTRVFVYRLLPERESRPYREAGGHKHLKEGLHNLENVLAYLEGQDASAYYDWLNRALDKIPQFSFRGERFSLEKMSPGERKLFEMLVLLANNYSLLCFDEPDVSLYYKLIEALLKEVRDYTLRVDNAQIFITTHNTNMLQGLRPEEVWVLERSGLNNATARPADRDPLVRAMYEEGIDMGTLWYGGYLGEG